MLEGYYRQKVCLCQEFLYIYLKKEIIVATIQCQGCGKRIIQKGGKCPHCGEPIPLTKPKLLRPDISKNINKKEEIGLVKCGVCGEQISKNALGCPHCGEPDQDTQRFFKSTPTKKKTSWWTWFFLLFFIAYVVGTVTNGGKHKNTSSSSSYTKPIKHEEKIRTTLKGGYFACTTAALFDEATSASINKDNLAIGYLLSHGCVLTKKGVRISIVDLGITTTKIRAYTVGESIILYTNTENVYY